MRQFRKLSEYVVKIRFDESFFVFWFCSMIKKIECINQSKYIFKRDVL